MQAGFLIPEGGVILFTNDYSAVYQAARENTPPPDALKKRANERAISLSQKAAANRRGLL
ncbi:hypothetical protein CD006_01720 [Enterobacter sp. 10-1]|uniref:hypothetical protein n=1 Tax=Raoultella TaxID=160674 RepID=UPI000BA3FF2B|nr:MULTISPECIES: hypothetical protein [Enterobacteriaceae]MVT01403.1 hypothetical protein [Raoultella sp. 10-1]PAC13951.1 hypothetical protein CD006_01720 [Enterobacter sp. 10-1]